MQSIGQRKLGRSGIELSMLGLGCWAIGGTYRAFGRWSGWGEVDDDESVRAIRRAMDLGVTFFDTADSYGCGHSERVLARALGPRRDQVVIATKVGLMFDEDERQFTGRSAEPQYIRRACDQSLRRLNTEVIDLYQLHLGDHDIDQAAAVRDLFEQLVAAGKIRHYGWSTDDPDRAAVFAEGKHCTAVQQSFNILEGNAQTLSFCEQRDLASIIRGPLAKGLLTGKFTADSKPPDDLRRDWDLKQGPVADQLANLERLRDVLVRDGRSLTQAALGWLWARSERTIPIPGFKTVAQVEENVGACGFGALAVDQMGQIDAILDRLPGDAKGPKSPVRGD